MEVYLDNSATTKPYDEVVNTMLKVLRQKYANPSSMYRPAMDVDKMMSQARMNVADVINAKAEEILFTSGGTEANNTAIKGTAAALKRHKKRIITSVIEHPSVIEVVKNLSEEGFDIKYASVDKFGLVNIDEIKEYLTEDTALISIMAVNNEIGSIQPLKEIGRIAREKGVRFHVDAVQGYGKVPLNVTDMNIDMMSISAHKIHGPKGSGALYIRKGTRILPILDGGGQEYNIRSGTENVPGIVGFGRAANMAIEDMDKRMESIKALKMRLWDGISHNIDDCFINGPDIKIAAPHILNVSFLGVRGEVLLHALEDKGIYVSTGSACSSHKKKHSYVLKSLGLSSDRIDSAIRFSLSPLNTVQEIDYTIDVLIDVVKEYRKFYRR